MAGSRTGETDAARNRLARRRQPFRVFLLVQAIIQGVWEAVGKLKEEGLSILLVEQNAHLALKLVDYVHVMSKGNVVYSAKPAELKANEEIKSSYLGI